MNFAITWLFDKLGYMPKIDVTIGRVVDFQVEKQTPAVKKTTTRKPTAKKVVAKKATKVVKKAK
jgi:hypothetical protein